MIIIPSFQTSSADFSQTINLNNQSVKIRLVFNVRVQCWFMDFTDSNGTTIYGIKLVTNYPLLYQHKSFLNFNGELLVLQSDSKAGDIITYDNLNNGWSLVFVTPDELKVLELN